MLDLSYFPVEVVKYMKHISHEMYKMGKGSVDIDDLLQECAIAFIVYSETFDSSKGMSLKNWVGPKMFARCRRHLSVFKRPVRTPEKKWDEIEGSLQVVPASDLGNQENYALYFVDHGGNQIIRSNLTGNYQITIQQVSAPHRNDRLFVRQNTSRGYDLFLHLDADQREDVQEKLIQSNFAFLVPIDSRIAEGHDKNASGTWFNFGSAPSLAVESEWEVYTGFWPMEGIRGVNNKTEDTFSYSLETPLASWTVRNATLINDNRVVMQLGEEQMCILDHLQKKSALIARGKGPVVVKKQ